MSQSSLKKAFQEPYVRNWFFLSLFCALFSIIYECFSHGVYANAMIFLFVTPFLLGTLPCLILACFQKDMPGRLYQDGVLALSLAQLLTGILEIYGTSSDLTLYFMIFALFLLGSGVFAYIFRHLPMRRS